MSMRFILPLVSGSLAFLLFSCSPDSDVPLLTGQTQAASDKGEALYKKAKQADDSGQKKTAIKLYDKTATLYPFADAASKARYRQAEMLDQSGQPLQAFDAYQLFLSRFHASSLYSSALARQAKIAYDAADGKVRKSFLGFRMKVDVKVVVEMLGKVRDNAPKTATAAKAQMTIGEHYQHEHKFVEAISAYRQLVRDQPDVREAPEALFRVGMVFIEQADLGNRNQATLSLAREAFNDYLNQYPNHFRNAEARKRIANLGSRELKSSFEIAEFYYKTHQYKSAKVYYRDIMKRSTSGNLHDASRARLKELGE